MSTLRPLPTPDADSQPFWVACAEHRLSAQRCDHCGSWRWPPMALCPHCYVRGGTWHTLPGTGRIESFVVVDRAFDPAFADELPLIVATVRLDGADGVVLRSNVIGCRADQISIGDTVAVTFRDMSSTVSLPLFTAI